VVSINAGYQNLPSIPFKNKENMFLQLLSSTIGGSMTSRWDQQASPIAHGLLLPSAPITSDYRIYFSLTFLKIIDKINYGSYILPKVAGK
jgi:hypothetical protein